MTASPLLIPDHIEEGARSRCSSVRPSPRPCDDCGEIVLPYVAFTGGWYSPQWCARCLDYSEAEEIARLSVDQDQRSSSARWSNAGLTPRDVAASFELDPRLARLSLESPSCFCYVVGRTGTGKTTQVIEAVKHYMSKRWSCRYVVEGDLLEALRPQQGDARRWQISELVDLDLLVIDEFGSESSSSWSQEQLRRIINGRYRRRAPTILASNHPLLALVSKCGLGETVVSRIIEGCGGLEAIKSPHSQHIELTYSYRLRREVGG